MNESLLGKRKRTSGKERISLLSAAILEFYAGKALLPAGRGGCPKPRGKRAPNKRPNPIVGGDNEGG